MFTLKSSSRKHFFIFSLSVHIILSKILNVFKKRVLQTLICTELILKHSPYSISCKRVQSLSLYSKKSSVFTRSVHYVKKEIPYYEPNRTRREHTVYHQTCMNGETATIDMVFSICYTPGILTLNLIILLCTLSAY